MIRATVRTPTIEFSRRGSVSPEPGGDVVRRRGVIFRSGVYENQQFTMSPAELKALAASFSGPIKLDHGHPTTDGPIDFGILESVEASADGTTLWGTTATPVWLDKALGDARWLVSASFDRATKAIRRLSLVTRPQISDAELQAAFACACGGHDPVTKEEPPMPDEDNENEDVLSEDDEKALDILWGLPDGKRAELLSALQDAATAPEPTPAEFALKQRVEQLEAENKAARLASFAARADSFATAQVVANRLLPTEKPRVVELHTQAAIDDFDHPAEFGASKQKSRVAAYEASITARPPHGWTEERVANFGRVLPNGGEEPDAAKVKAQRFEALMGMTSNGQAALAAIPKG